MADLSQVYEALRRADAAGNVEDATKLAQFIQSQTALPEAPAEIQKSGTAGPIEALVGGAKRLGASSLTALQAPFVGGEEAAARGVARQEAIKERPGASLEEIKKVYQEKGLLPAIKETATQIPAGLAEQAPNIAAMLASGRLGAMAGSAFGPLGTAVGGIGGALLPSFLPQAGANIERQRQEGKEVELGKAYGAAIPQAALDVGAMEFGLGKLFKISPTTLGTEAAEKLAKESLLKAAGKGALKTAAFEMPTEITQQMLERAQAGLPLTTPDAVKEYTDVAYAAGLLSPLGGVSGVSARGEARDIVRQNDLARAQELGRIQAERDRIDQIVEDAKQEAQLNLEEEQKKNKVSADTFKDMGVGSTAKVGPRDNRVKLYDELIGLDATLPEDNIKIRNTLEDFLKNKEEDAPQSQAIRKYLDTLPKLEELKDETAIVERPRESVQIPGQPMAGELAGGVEGVDRTGLGGTAGDVRQLTGREETRGLALEDIAPIEPPKVAPAKGIQAALKQAGGISTEHLFDLTGEKSVNKSGATVGLFTKNGRGLDDAVQVAVEQGYLPASVLDEVDGGVEKLSDLIMDEIYGKKAVPLDQQADTELEAYLAREQQKQLVQEVAPRIEDAKGLAKELGGESAQILQAPFGNPGYNYTNKDGVEVTFRPEGRIFELTPGDESTQVGSDVHLDYIGSKVKGQGLASKELDRIIKKADENNLSLSIEVSKQDKEGLSNAQLKKWYERKGFIFPGGYDSEVGYRPRSDEDISQYQQKTITISDGKIPSVENQINSDLRNRTFSEPDSFFGHYGNGDLLTGYHAVPSYATKFDDIYYYDGRTKPTKVEDLKAEYNSTTRKLELSRINLKDEDINKQLAEAAAQEKGILEAPPKELAEPTPIYNKVTNADEALKTIVKEANQPQKALINLLRRVPNIGTTRFTTTREVASTGNAPGYFDPNTNHIYVNPKAKDHVQITLHEIYHAATEAALDKHVKTVNGKPVGVTPLGKKAVRLFDAFNEAALKKQKGFYGQENIKEFFSEAETNPELKQFLQNQESVLKLKPAKGKIATLWSDFVNLIKSMFNIPDSAHSMLDEVLLLSPQFMTGPEVTTAPREVLEARRAPEGLTRPDGTSLKYLEDETKSTWEKIGDVWSSDNNQWRKWGDWLGNKIVGGRYSLERKGIDAGLPEVDLLNGGRIRGDLINLQATNGQSIAQAGLYLGRLDVRKSGMVIADRSTGDFKVSMLDISTGWNNLLGRATEELGSRELAYDMLTAGWYGPRYEELAQYNDTVGAGEKINIDEWTESDKRTAREAWRRYGDELSLLRDMRNVQRKDLLDFMVKTGLYTREKAQRFLDRSEYVALYRVPEEEMEAYEAKPFTKVGGLLGAAKEYRLLGSSRAAADPMDNYIANMSWMMQRGIKNNAAKHTADMLQQIGQGQWMDRPLTDIEKKAVNYVSVNIDGTPKEFIVVDANDMAAFASSPVITGAVWDLMKFPVSALRHGITMMPQFVWNQAWEDPVRATFVSGNRAGFMKNIRDTWTSIVKNQFSADRTPNAELLNRYGIIGQKDILDSQDLIDKYKGKDKSGWRKYVFVLERMAQGSDLGAREAIYKNATAELAQEGMDPETAQDYAAVRAHRYMPYQQTGTSRSLAYLRRMMPFVNPPIQGLARDIAAARGRIGGISRADGKKALAWRLAKYAAFTAMYAAFMSGDDEYENQSDDQQDNNFFLGGARIPVPQELRPIKVAVERATRAWVLDAPGSDVEDSAVIGATLRKFWEITAGFAPVPTIARPLVENYTNFDIFSGLPIVSRGQEMKEPAYQYTDRTSEVAKVIGQSINYSPIKIDHIIKGYLGYMGSTLTQMTNYLADDRPAPTINETLFIGSMLQNQHATGARSDFFELYDKVSRVKATANALKDANDVEGYKAYVEENKGYMSIAPAINALHNQVNKLRDTKKAILNSNKSAEEKRQILDQITANETKMLSRVREIERKALEAQD